MLEYCGGLFGVVFSRTTWETEDIPSAGLKGRISHNILVLAGEISSHVSMW